MSHESTPNINTVPEAVETEPHETQPAEIPSLDKMIADAEQQTPPNVPSSAGGPGCRLRERAH